ncbi:hypothetical protein RB598_007234 [Gaeumannomyces tritici]
MARLVRAAVRPGGLAHLAASRPLSMRPGVVPLGYIRRRPVFSLAKRPSTPRHRTPLAPLLVGGGLLVYSLYPSDDFQHMQRHGTKAAPTWCPVTEPSNGDARGAGSQQGAWSTFASSFEGISKMTEGDWGTSTVVGFILPEWTKLLPGYLRKLQRELSLAPGSLADEVWADAHDPSVHPEIRYSASVRVSSDLCDDEKSFLERRRKVARVALAKYLGLAEEDIHPDDMPTIGICGSGGGLRALVAGAGSMCAASEDGLFDCVTYMAGVSGSCWLQSMYFSTITNCDMHQLIDHLKARLSVHIAFPPAAFSALVSAPTNKPLLSGLIEKLKGDPKADFGLVDVYGILLAARLLVPRGELDVDEQNFKLSHQRQYVRAGANPLPIYTAVRHEIPDVDVDSPAEVPSASEESKAKAKKEAWFQWFEITPYEFFCEEFEAGIPTWAMGRRFRDGKDMPQAGGLHLPEIRMPLLLGMFGSAFCATLSHYYREIQPLVQSMSGFAAIDQAISGRNEDLSKVHPIDPTSLPNPVYGMGEGKLPKTAPASLPKSEYIQLMDAGMSNNLPIYPLLRPGRNVEVIIAFDASADIKTDNWLSVADGYARQRGIKGWPVGIGWPKEETPPQETAKQLQEASASSTDEAERKVQDAQHHQAAKQPGGSGSGVAKDEATAAMGHDGEAVESKNKYEEAARTLGYCTVWVGTTQERSTEPPPPIKSDGDGDSWRLMEPDAGIAVVYMPFLPNDKVADVDPASSDYMSTWNFTYTPDQVDKVVALAKANYSEGREQIRATVRAVYERKRRLREQREEAARRERYRRLLRRGDVGKLGEWEGDHFS